MNVNLGLIEEIIREELEGEFDEEVIEEVVAEFSSIVEGMFAQAVREWARERAQELQGVVP